MSSGVPPKGTTRPTPPQSNFPTLTRRRPGPKSTVVARPLDLRRLPKRGGSRAVAFIERYVTLPKGTGARRRMRLRPWQKAIVHGLFDEPRPRQALVAISAGNGKTTLAAALGLYGLLADRVEGAQVICVASDERQARILLNTARRMVELDPDLYARVQIFKDHLLEPHTDSTLFALPADPGALQGWDPSLCVVDELAVVTDDVFEAMAARAGKREQSLLLAISTPPKIGDDGVMRRLVDHGRQGTDPSFYFREFIAPAGCEVDDEAAWEVANPALDDFLHRDALRAVLPPKMRENAFRGYRLGQWVALEDAWLPDGAWAACASASASIPAGAEVVLGFDGSYNGDTTAIVAATVGGAPHLELIGIWDRPEDAVEWAVPVLDVEQALRDACRRWQVREIACDVFRWARTFQILTGEGLPVVEYPQTPSRMTPATTRFYEAVMLRTLSHSGDPTFARHVANCTVREDTRGVRLAKEHRYSKRRIDAAVAAVMAFDRACDLAGDRGPSIYVFD
jgi:phage terminase large subunit-like protein